MANWKRPFYQPLLKLRIPSSGLAFFFSLAVFLCFSTAYPMPIPVVNSGFENEGGGTLEGWTAEDTAPGAASAINLVWPDEWGGNLISGDLGGMHNAYTASLSQTFTMPSTTEEVTWSFWFDSAGITTTGYSSLGFEAKLEGDNTAIGLKFYKGHSLQEGIFYNIYYQPILTINQVDWWDSFWVTSGDLKKIFEPDETITLSYTEYGLSKFFVPDIVIDDRIPGDAEVTTLGDNVTLHPVPEPTTMLLLGSGLMGFGGLRWRFRKG